METILLLCTYRSDELSSALRSWVAAVGRLHLAQEVRVPPLDAQDVAARIASIFQLQQSAHPEFYR